MPLVALDAVTIAFGHLPLLDEVTLRIDPRERIAVIGRNGTGKSTLLKILSGAVQPDAGTVWREPGLRAARLEQDVPLSAAKSVVEVVAEGHTHHTAADEEWIRQHAVDVVLSRLNLDGDAVVDTLSGGWRRRVLLARALVGQPDLLLLDEPTNHLDIDAITWLEEFLAGYRGAVAFVTHDRAFLQRIATRIVELDRGRLTSWPGDYATYQRRKEEALAAETAERARFDDKLAEEEAWVRQGIKARRTRNEGRVRALEAMREERLARREEIGQVRLQAVVADARAPQSGKLVFELDKVSKGYAGTPVVREFSARVMRGDRIGLIGPNGAGKTTLLKLLMGELQPDTGRVRRGANVEIAYYDQQREQLDPERTVVSTIGDGNDTVTVNGRTRHVNAYLADFLFPPERANSPVKALSGGERNRLLLARLFTRPANVLVLDEPTNDLDIETLELLEDQLADWPGTLLLVSHDRALLDNVVTTTFAFEGGGDVHEYVGGYGDWVRQRRPPAPSQPAPSAAKPASRSGGESRGATAAVASKKLSYKEQRELEALPSRIEALEAEERQLNTRIAGAEFYKEGGDAIAAALARLAEASRELGEAYARWHELESRAPASGGWSG
ncbi:MAG: ATP-binding cassette domain-containing protein [Acidobacteria bacterium]|nr:ATP-binding cassette domain-containing protein [Acidobacteriota bacterium]